VGLSRKRQNGFAPNYFSGFEKKHLFITTCIEKRCTRSLSYADPSIKFAYIGDLK